MLHHRTYFRHIKASVKLQFYLGFICLAVVAISRHNSVDIISALLAIVIVLVPTLTYIKVAFANGMVGHPKVVLARHQMAMLLKFAVTAALFALVYIIYKQCNFFVLLITYCVSISGQWLALIKG